VASRRMPRADRGRQARYYPELRCSSNAPTARVDPHSTSATSTPDAHGHAHPLFSQSLRDTLTAF
jgi:hypothetical protein